MKSYSTVNGAVKALKDVPALKGCKYLLCIRGEEIGEPDRLYPVVYAPDMETRRAAIKAGFGANHPSRINDDRRLNLHAKYGSL